MPRTTKTTKPATTAKTASNGSTGPSAADKLRTALRRHPESTARELAELAGIGTSTATKLLAAWAADGQAVRIPGQDTGGRKPAARWAPPQAMTPGATAETVDGMSLGKIGRIIDALRHERFQFSPDDEQLHGPASAGYVSTARKNGRTPFQAILSAVSGNPWMPPQPTT
jgi:hypothetical protein